MTNRELVALLEKIDRRLSALEKNSHPPIDLAPGVREIVRQELEKRGC